jgi:hypothetical protein
MEVNYDDLYKLRILVFIENEPQSNLYRQVILSPHQYQSVSSSIGEGGTPLKVLASEDLFKLPDLEDVCEEA